MTAAAEPLLIAHRGSSARAPENTLAAIRAALEDEAPWIEIDVRETADGRLILQHDATLKKFNGDTREVSKMTFAESRKADVGTWFNAKFAGEAMPTLEEALEATKSVTLLIEHKAGSAENYAKVIRAQKAADRVVVQSFNWKFLRDLKAVAPELQLGALDSKELTEAKLADLVKLKPKMVGWKATDLTKEMVEQFHKAGFEVAAWTVNDIPRARQLVRKGVDAIITDKPKLLRSPLLGF